jgi:hypothetical protein
MEASDAARYTPIREFSVVRLLSAMVCAAILSFPLGVAFGWGSPSIPIFYLLLPIAMLFGAFLGHTILVVLQRTHVHHQGAATVAVMTSVLTAVIGACLGERWVRLHQALYRGLVECPINFFVPLAELLDFAGSSFGKSSADLSGFSFLGPPLPVAWSTEAVSIAAISTVVVRRKLRAIPYCESCGRWTVLTRGVRFLNPDGEPELVKELNRGQVRAILAVVPAPEDAPGSLRVDIGQCGGCSESVYLSLSRVPMMRGTLEFLWPSAGEGIRHLKISAEDAADLRKPPKLSDFAPPSPGNPRPKK